MQGMKARRVCLVRRVQELSDWRFVVFVVLFLEERVAATNGTHILEQGQLEGLFASHLSSLHGNRSRGIH